MALTQAQLAAVNLVNAADPQLGSYVYEAALALHKSHDGVRGKLLSSLRTKLGLTGDAYWESDFQLESVFDTNVVYRLNGKEWRHPYTLNDGEVVLTGDAVETELSFIDVAQESAGVRGSAREWSMGSVVESKSQAGTGLIRVIQPGWGSSGYYSREVLQRDSPKIFKAGTHMMWDHATESMMQDYPAQQLSRQAGVLTSDAKWMEDGPVGPGAYAEYKSFSEFTPRIQERAQYGAIAVSWMGYVQWVEGKVEGRKGKVAKELLAAESVDFVTLAGAGGAIVRASESAVPRQQEKKVAKVEIEDTELSTLRESANRVTALETSLRTAREASAKAIVASLLTGRKLSDKARESFTNLALSNIPVAADGTLDEAAFRSSVEGIVADFPAEAAATTTESAAGTDTSGAVKLGNGGTAQTTAENVRESRIKLYMKSGFSKEVAEKMAGR